MDGRIRDLVRDMFETMYSASGIGLAAPQVGVGKRVIVVDVSPVEKEIAPVALVNPVIVEREGMVEGTEGCLSIPGVEGIVPRAESVLVRALDPQGQPVEIGVYNVQGRLLKPLARTTQGPGRYTVSWDATDQRGERVATGVYFLHVRLGPERRPYRMVYLGR